MLTQVAEGVLVHRSELIRNNTVVVQGRAGVLLIDPGTTGAEMACLANDLSESGRPVVAGFATHPDWDHVLWHAQLGEAPRYGTARCAAHLRELRSDASWKARVAGGLPPQIAEETPLDLFGLITGLPAGTVRIPWDGPQVRIIEHPAHSPGHAALLIEECGVLVAGDMLSDVLITPAPRRAERCRAAGRSGPPAGPYPARTVKAPAGRMSARPAGSPSPGRLRSSQSKIQIVLLPARKG